ncbi:YggS family pyridoxal phosphate-dependent enzyme [Pleionea sp. CnH1-48]|uniref:YggS family pyridoxal phosphate-dependent enzyme n=1 Tax=Pleionea sp. CnH1-48 TaxID=2954494 RepID=UPI0020980370|nr:YggS family pyridoxal phosphate-dependent enzyme [Pleionea sp. CnH1-48]MCO7225269.1 YggS family pyridoxal phosphate-dependent enzyme [Pleionea sp. CnH1-48]
MTIEQNLNKVNQLLQDAIEEANRTVNSVTLLAVSKAQKINNIGEAYAAGQKAFGESYVQEAVDKIQALREYDIEWHFIGPIQSNKTRDIAQHFDWVQSVDRLKIARRLNEQRPEELAPLNICVQVDLFAESSKQGATTEELKSLLDYVCDAPRLNLKGIMAIPPKQQDTAQQLKQFEQISQLFLDYQHQYPSLTTLSMGMSQDMTAAIAAGSTMVRVGTGIFGPRPANWKQQI